MDRGMQQQLDEAARQYGVGSPEYIETSRRIQAENREARGKLAGQVGMAYNEGRAKMSQSYDQIAATFRESYDRSISAAELSTQELGLKAVELEKNIDESFVQNKKNTELAASALEMTAADLYQRGSTYLSNMLLNYSDVVVPISDLMIEALNMQEEGMAERSNIGLMGATFQQTGAIPGGSKTSTSKVSSTGGKTTGKTPSSSGGWIAQGPSLREQYDQSIAALQGAGGGTDQRLNPFSGPGSQYSWA